MRTANNDNRYGVLGRETVYELLRRSSHLSHDAQFDLLDWANEGALRHALVETICSGLARVTSVERIESGEGLVDIRVHVKLTDAGRRALADAEGAD